MQGYDHEWLCRQVVEKINDAILFSDRGGIIRLWNAGAESMFGFTAGEAIGQSLDLITPENLRARHWEGYYRVMETGVSRYEDNLHAVPALKKDGARISVEFSLALIRNGGGEILGVSAVTREVTARWQREKALKERLAALEAQVGARGAG